MLLSIFMHFHQIRFLNNKSTSKKFFTTNQNSQIFFIIKKMQSAMSAEMLKMFEKKIKAVNKTKSSSSEKELEEDSQNVIELSESEMVPKVKSNKPRKISFPKVYFMNNLLKLSNIVLFQELQTYIYQQAERSQIPYPKLLMYYGIEKLVQLTHEKYSDIKQKNIDKLAFSEIEKDLFYFLVILKSRDRLLVSKIFKGACKRFGAQHLYSEEWLTNYLTTHRKGLQSNSVNVNELLYNTERKQLEDTKNYPFKPPRKQFHLETMIKKYPTLNLQTDGEEELQNPEVKHYEKQLYYWQKQNAQIFNATYDIFPQSKISEVEEKKPSKKSKKQPVPKDFIIIMNLQVVKPEQNVYANLDEEKSTEKESQIEEKVKNEQKSSDFKIKITQEQINGVLNEMQKSVQKIAKQFQLTENDVDTVYRQKQKYKKLLAQKPQQEQAPDDLVFYVLDNKIRKFIRKNKSFDLSSIQGECGRILQQLSIEKGRHAPLIKKWMLNFIEKK